VGGRHLFLLRRNHRRFVDVEQRLDQLDDLPPPVYRGVLRLREDGMALALVTATQVPLVVAITTVAVDGGHMRTSTAAAPVVLSSLAGPLHGLRVRRIAAERHGCATALPPRSDVQVTT
jgi:hypothetical protein